MTSVKPPAAWAAANMTSLWTVQLKMKSGGLQAI